MDFLRQTSRIRIETNVHHDSDRQTVARTRHQIEVKDMTDDDLKLFQQEMADVRPIDQSGRAVLTHREAPTPGQLYRRESAQRGTDFDENQLPTAFVEFVHPEATISFKRDGIQNGVFRRLCQGDTRSRPCWICTA